MFMGTRLTACSFFLFVVLLNVVKASCGEGQLEISG